MLRNYIYATAAKFHVANWDWFDKNEAAINSAVELVQCFPNCRTKETFRYWRELCMLNGIVLMY